MEPRIQYAKTSDGVNIAFWTLGEGEPLIEMPPIPISHIQMEWQIPVFRRWYECVAENRKLIRYDSRGSGLSERNVTDFSLDSLVLDVEAVIDGLGLEKFSLFPLYHSGLVAIAYAARNPERVSNLILWHCWARTLDTASSQLRGLRRLLEVDWELYAETMAHDMWGWSEGEAARRYAAVIRESMTQEVAQAFVAASREHDVGALLPQVKSPTLVLHRRQTSLPQIDVVRGLVSGLPNARLVLLEGASGAPFLGDMESVLQAIDEFLGDAGEQKEALPQGTTIILFVDIADSTALTERLGDAAFRERARKLDEALLPAIHEAGGSVIEGKLLGDGVLATFSSARQAIEAALRCRGVGEECELPLHLGIHAGDVIREAGNVHGGAVNLAARIADASAPGEILVSDTLRGLARTSAGVAFEDRGEHELKGITEPVRLYEVRWGDG